MLIKPDYEKSVVNLVSTFLKHFNCNYYHQPYSLEGSFEAFLTDAEKVVIFILDGLSYNKFVENNENDMFRNYFKVSSVFPTTTSSAVPSWFTGRTPKEHGLLGYILYLRELGSLVNMLEFSYPGIEGNIYSTIIKKKLHRLDNVFDLLKEKDKYGGILTHASISNSGLSYLIHKNGHLLTYQYMGDLLASLKKRLNEDWEGMLYIYWGFLDGLGHKKGPDSEAFSMELKRVLRELRHFIESELPEDTLFVITSDHGMKQIPNDKNYLIKHIEAFNRHLSLPPAGEMRMMYFYLKKPWKIEEFKNFLQEQFGDTFELYSSKELDEKGYFGFGKPHPEFYNRIGDAVLIVKENYAFTYLYTGGEDRLSGMHGSLTEDELFVPVIFARKKEA